ncbi:hypothetical protein EDD17DRAFT_1505964 [Pisolithus thermaeus]|nr:hypothetical protein EV401DRAFT_1895630 [Pisolithus croceorrhizus]KAI6165517.1 hypothetical protein EDD17DRAFT_1505964 [Pisolithus thermaeus]
MISNRTSLRDKSLAALASVIYDDGAPYQKYVLPLLNRCRPKVQEFPVLWQDPLHRLLRQDDFGNVLCAMHVQGLFIRPFVNQNELLSVNTALTKYLALVRDCACPPFHGPAVKNPSVPDFGGSTAARPLNFRFKPEYNAARKDKGLDYYIRINLGETDENYEVRVEYKKMGKRKYSVKQGYEEKIRAALTAVQYGKEPVYEKAAVILGMGRKLTRSGLLR